MNARWALLGGGLIVLVAAAGVTVPGPLFPVLVLALVAGITQRDLIARRIGAIRVRRRLDAALAGSTLTAAVSAADPLVVVQQRLLGTPGAGAYMGGWTDAGEPVQSNGRGALGVIGGPGSGKTRGVIIPAVLAHPAPVVAVSTKPEVLAHTWRARTHQGSVTVFDPAGLGLAEQYGLVQLRWSPTDSAGDYEAAMVTARAMIRTAAKGRGDDHWTERAGVLLGVYLHAAALAELGMLDVLHWVLASDVAAPAAYLPAGGTPAAVLAGLEATPDKERGGIFSTAAGVLGAYQSESAIRSATPAPDTAGAVWSLHGEAFASGVADTIYVVAPAARQDLLAPVIVGLLTAVREATYAVSAQLVRSGRSERRDPPVLLALDEAANIAPLPDLPALCSEAGGQGVQIMPVFQDLSQARQRWGQEGEGLLSLLSSVVVLPGIRDRASLELISMLIGDWDRPVETVSEGRSESVSGAGLFGGGQRTSGATAGTSWTTRRERIMDPAQIAQLAGGQALAIVGSEWGQMQLAMWDQHPVWRAIARAGEPGHVGEHAGERPAQAGML